jgi:hypothetical protein
MWKDYEELENSLSMPELTAVLVAKRESKFEEHKFLAALQGVDLDDSKQTKQKATSFDDIKARVFSGGQAKDANDILSLQGINASQAGFGIGAGLSYENIGDGDAKW